MLRGDLQTTPLADLLRSLAGAAATGCVYLLPEGQRFDAEEATITLREGAICGVTLPSTGDSLGTRLVATHQLTPDELAEAKLAQETELATWMLADLLIHLGLADEQHVQAVTAEQALSDLTYICSWDSGSWRFRRRARLGRNLPSPLPVDEALATVGTRIERWHRLLPTILGADAVVALAANNGDGPDPDASDSADPDMAVEMDPDAFVLLCTVDGTRTITDLAEASGFTLLDAGLLTAQLVGAGLVQVTRDMSRDPLPGDVLDPPEDSELPVPDGATDEPADVLAAAFSFEGDGPLLPENIPHGFAPTGPEWEPPSWQQSDRLADALARVSAALSEAMIEPSSAEAETLAVEFVEPNPLEAAPLDALSELAHEDAFADNPDDTSDEDVANEFVADSEDVAEAEAFLEATVEEPFDDAFLEAVEAVTTHEPPEAHTEAEPAVAVQESIEAPVEAPVEAPEAKPAGRTAHAAEASRMLSQLAGDNSSEPVQNSAEDEAPEPEPAPEPAAEQQAAPPGYAPTPRRQTDPADTAALLRELSSLGAENGGGRGSGGNRPSPPRPAPASAPNSSAQQRKRKGLFGRN